MCYAIGISNAAQNSTNSNHERSDCVVCTRKWAIQTHKYIKTNAWKKNARIGNKNNWNEVKLENP